MGPILGNVMLPYPIPVLVMVPPTYPLSIIISIKRDGIIKNHDVESRKSIQNMECLKEDILTPHGSQIREYDATKAQFG